VPHLQLITAQQHLHGRQWQLQQDVPQCRISPHTLQVTEHTQQPGLEGDSCPTPTDTCSTIVAAAIIMPSASRSTSRVG